MAAGKGNRQGHRDATMILVAFRHGLRVAELVDLRWDQIDYAGSRLHVRRVKRGTPATHPLHGVELRALRRLQREAPQSEFVFLSERGTPFSTAGFAKMVERAGVEAGLQIRGPSPHAAACLWLCAGQCRPRHPVAAGLSRAQKHSAHGALHRVVAGTVQELLALGAFRADWNAWGPQPQFGWCRDPWLGALPIGDAYGAASSPVFSPCWTCRTVNPA